MIVAVGFYLCGIRDGYDGSRRERFVGYQHTLRHHINRRGLPTFTVKCYEHIHPQSNPQPSQPQQSPSSVGSGLGFRTRFRDFGFVAFCAYHSRLSGYLARNSRFVMNARSQSSCGVAELAAGSVNGEPVRYFICGESWPCIYLAVPRTCRSSPGNNLCTRLQTGDERAWLCNPDELHA